MKTTERPRLVFMGTPDFAVPSLVKLLEDDANILAVYTRPDRPRGRGQRVAYSPVKETALAHKLPLVQPDTLKTPEIQTELAALRPDLFIVVAYGLLLPPALLDIPTWGALNVHASLLPRYRGAAPIQWAIISGAEATGVTTMRLDAGLDTGDILLQESIPIRPDETSRTLHDRLARLGAQLLRDTLKSLRDGTLIPRPQDGSLATWAPPLKKEQGRLNWALSAGELDCRIRGLTPWPRAYTRLRGKRLIVHRARPGSAQVSGTPGTIYSTGETGIQVQTGKGLLTLLEVQIEGHRRLASQDFLKGFPLSPGERLV
jgi:methionyl-tRNA formyltransferase